MAFDSLLKGLLPLTRRTLGACLNATPASKASVTIDGKTYPVDLDVSDPIQNESATFELFLALQQQMYQPGDTYSSTSLYQQIQAAGGGGSFPPAWGLLADNSGSTYTNPSVTIPSWGISAHSTNMAANSGTGLITVTNAGDYFILTAGAAHQNTTITGVGQFGIGSNTLTLSIRINGGGSVADGSCGMMNWAVPALGAGTWDPSDIHTPADGVSVGTAVAGTVQTLAANATIESTITASGTLVFTDAFLIAIRVK